MDGVAMSVKDLIEFLKKVDPDLRVYLADFNEDYRPPLPLAEDDIHVGGEDVVFG